MPTYYKERFDEQGGWEFSDTEEAEIEELAREALQEELPDESSERYTRDDLERQIDLIKQEIINNQ